MKSWTSPPPSGRLKLADPACALVNHLDLAEPGILAKSFQNGYHWCHERNGSMATREDCRQGDDSGRGSPDDMPDGLPTPFGNIINTWDAPKSFKQSGRGCAQPFGKIRFGTQTTGIKTCEVTHLSPARPLKSPLAHARYRSKTLNKAYTIATRRTWNPSTCIGEPYPSPEVSSHKSPTSNNNNDKRRHHVEDPATPHHVPCQNEHRKKYE